MNRSRVWLVYAFISIALYVFSTPGFGQQLSQRDSGTTLAGIGSFNDREYLVANPPADLAIQQTGGKIVLTWTQMPNASSYTVESSSEISSDYVDVTWQGSFSTMGNTISWSRSLIADRQFYRVRSVKADITGSMVMVQGGTFSNGTADVTLSSFLMDKYEVTQAQYQTMIGSNPASGLGVGPDYPVYNVSWFNVIYYCNWRSISEGLTPCYSYSTYGTNPSTWPSGWNTSAANHTNITCNWNVNGYRLPTEMEWLFAARGGNFTHNYTYSGSNNIDDVAWYLSNSGSMTHPVGLKTPNELNIYDMTGNTWEWCWDIFGNLPVYAQTNPHGAASGTLRSLLGGCWNDNAGVCALNYRCNYSPEMTYFGFRVCRSIPQPAPSQMVYVNGGTFNNGTSNVTLSSFTISNFETTQVEYQRVMGTNPAQFTSVTDAPVERVTWFKAVEYCNRKSILENLTPCYSYGSYGTNPNGWPSGWDGADANHLNVTCNWSANGYRLPSEAEWEFAARGGTLTHGYTYSGGGNVNSVAWYENTSGGTSHTVGTKVPNELNLFDMSGNVYEWVWDILGNYPSGAQTNPHGATSGDNRVFRGGGWMNNAQNQTVYNRPYGTPTSNWYNLGFRVCRNFSYWTYVPEGTFNNGVADIHLSAFYMSGVECGQPSFTSVTGRSPFSGYGVGAEYPAYNTSWFDAIEYCNRVSISSGLTPCYSYGIYGQNPTNWPTGWRSLNSNKALVQCDWTANGYRLPTEMEWEYAARGGNLSNNYTFSGGNDLNTVGWYSGNASSTTHACGGKTPNELGLYDMSGNAEEWCWDYYSSLPSGALTDPHGPATGTYPVTKGGNWGTSATNCQVSFRTYSDATAVGSCAIGFRICRNDLKPVADPVISVASGTYYVPTAVTLTSNTYGASFRYTMDGSQPTPTHGTLYTAPVNIEDSCTLKAIAYLNGRVSSNVVEATYVMYLTVATPTFDPGTGTYLNAISVVISTATNGATIRYTLDGSDPTETSTLYSSPISVSTDTIIKARAYKSGWIPSATASAAYVITGTIATPTFTPVAGTYSVTQSVTLACATSGAEIRYTTDGSEPTEASALYSTPISVSTNTTIKAKAYKAGWNASETATAVYVISSMPSDFVLVGGGTFNNGTSNVTVSSFYMDKYEVTQVSYQAVMGTDPSYFADNSNRPVEMVSWFNAIEYCNRRSIMEGLTPCYSYSTYGTNPANWPSGWNTAWHYHTNVSCNWSSNGYRLPTEMEWMYAAKGGTQSQGYTYSGSNTIGNVAWYFENSNGRTWDVGTLASNEIGAFDMSGNVWEWCWDIYGDYQSGNQTNPTGATSGISRVRRGGSWTSLANSCSIAYRSNSGASFCVNSTGFRCVRNGMQQVTTPTFNPAAGTYSTAQNVTLACATSGAEIRYTTDGSEPTEASALYSTPISVSTNTTIKAKAYKAGWDASETATAVYVINTVPANFVLVGGGTFNNGTSNVTVSSFYMDKYEVTQQGYQTVMGTNPASGYGVGNSNPVYYVTWFNTIEYCNKRSMIEGLMPCYSYSTYGTNPADWPVGWATDWQNHIYKDLCVITPS